MPRFLCTNCLFARCRLRLAIFSSLPFSYRRHEETCESRLPFRCVNLVAPSIPGATCISPSPFPLSPQKRQTVACFLPLCPAIKHHPHLIQHVSKLDFSFSKISRSAWGSWKASDSFPRRTTRTAFLGAGGLGSRRLGRVRMRLLAAGRKSLLRLKGRATSSIMQKQRWQEWATPILIKTPQQSMLRQMLDRRRTVRENQLYTR